MKKLAKSYIPSKAFKNLKKFVIKDPIPFKPNKKASVSIIKSINKHSIYLDNLRTLCLSKIGLNGHCVVDLCQAIRGMLKL